MLLAILEAAEGESDRPRTREIWLNCDTTKGANDEHTRPNAAKAHGFSGLGSINYEHMRPNAAEAHGSSGFG